MMTFTMSTRCTLKNLVNTESLISNTLSNVFDLVLSMGSLWQSLNALARIEPEGLQFLVRVRNSLCPFNVEQTFPFPELVSWCSESYCHTTSILQNYKHESVLCSFTPQSIRGIFGLTDEFFQNSIPFSEIEMIDTFKAYDQGKKEQFLQTILNPGTDTQSLKYPCSISNFKREVQIVFSLLSQVLGLDYDQEISEVMLGFLVVYFEADKSEDSVTIAFDQFLSESINCQMVNFKLLQKFRYAAYLVKFIIDFNLNILMAKDLETFRRPSK